MDLHEGAKGLHGTAPRSIEGGGAHRRPHGVIPAPTAPHRTRGSSCQSSGRGFESRHSRFTKNLQSRQWRCAAGTPNPPGHAGV